MDALIIGTAVAGGAGVALLAQKAALRLFVWALAHRSER